MGIPRNKILTFCLLPSALCLSSKILTFCLLPSALYLSSTAAATTGGYAVQMAQMQTSQESERDAAQRLAQEAMQLFEQGTAESVRQAIKKWEQALPLLRKVGDKRWEAATLLIMGRVYDDLGETQKALEFYNQSLPLFRALGDKRGEAVTLKNIGNVYSALGETQKALDFYNQSLPLFRAVGDKNQEAFTLLVMGRIYHSVGETQKALDFYNQSLPLFQALGDKALEATTLNNIGRVYDDLGEKQKALDVLNQSLPLSRAVGDKALEATILNNIGLVYDALGEKQKALGYYNQSLPLSRAARDKAKEANILNNIGRVYDDLGEKQKALDYFNQSLPLSLAVKDQYAAARTLSNIGLVYNALGEKQKALDYFNQSLPLSRAVGDKAAEATMLNNIGFVYDALGEKQKALNYYNQSLPLSRAVGDKTAEARTLNNIGRVYDDLGEKQKALDYFSQSLTLSRAVGYKVGEAAILHNIGGVYDALGEKQKALDFYNQSLQLKRAMGDKAGEALTLNNIGKIYSDLKENQKALDFYNQSLPLSRAAGDRATEATTLSNIAALERNRGNLPAALTNIEAAIKIIEDLRTKIASPELRASYFATKQGEYEFYIDLLMQLHKKDPSKGYDALALHASERSRARSLLELLTEARANIRQGVKPQLLAKERDLQQQLDTLEKRRIELLSSKQPSSAAVAETDKLIAQSLDEYQQVRAAIRNTSPRYAALTQPQPLKLTEIQRDVLDDDTMLLQYSLGEERSYLWAVTKTSISSYELPKRAEIERLALEYYDLLNNPSYKLPQRGIGVLPRPNSPSMQAVNKLSQILLQPLAGKLGNQRLLIVADGVLQYVPFAALPAPDAATDASLTDETDKLSVVSATSVTKSGAPSVSSATKSGATPLLVNHEIINSPSATALAVLRKETNGRQAAPKSIAVLADPVFSSDDVRVGGGQQGNRGHNTVVPLQAAENLEILALQRSIREANITFDRLPFTRKEAERILSLVPETTRMQAFDFAANRTAANNPDLSKYKIVHFATHGILNSTHPELSGVVLSMVDKQGKSENGFLRLHDVFNLNLPAELVVLSACQTGLGGEVKGEGLVGLTRGFMYAGSPRVLVSLWNVSDEGTSELMVRFYQKMLQGGLKPAAALRAAQLELWNDKQWEAPYYWAAFTLQGEWR